MRRAGTYFFAFRRSAHRFFIISEMRFRASADIRRRRRPPGTLGSAIDAAAASAADRRPPTRARSLVACAVKAARRSRVAAISRSRPPSAHPISSADFSSASPLSFLGRPRGIQSSLMARGLSAPPAAHSVRQASTGTRGTSLADNRTATSPEGVQFWVQSGTIVSGRVCKLLRELAPRAGLEPATLRLTAGCSAIELPRIGRARRARERTNSLTHGSGPPQLRTGSRPTIANPQSANPQSAIRNPQLLGFSLDFYLHRPAERVGNGAFPFRFARDVGEC
jgi:hypothetical protein